MSGVYRPGIDAPVRAGSTVSKGGAIVPDFISPRSVGILNKVREEIGEMISGDARVLPVGDSEKQSGKTVAHIRDRVANITSFVTFSPDGHKSESELKFTLFEADKADLDLSGVPRYADIEVDRTVVRVPAVIKKGEKNYYYVLLQKGKKADVEMKTEDIIGLFTSDSSKKKSFGQKTFSVSLQSVVFTN